MAMKDHDFDRAGDDDRMHFIQCRRCGQWFDCRDIFEVLAHREHETPARPVVEPEYQPVEPLA